MTHVPWKLFTPGSDLLLIRFQIPKYGNDCSLGLTWKFNESTFPYMEITIAPPAMCYYDTYDTRLTTIKNSCISPPLYSVLCFHLTMFLMQLHNLYIRVLDLCLQVNL